MKVAAAPRPYRMRARAEAAAATAERILDATVALFWEDPGADVPLERVAARAEVSVQTIIRRFGGKEGLRLAAVEHEAGRVNTQRGQASPGDVEGSVRILVAHYEELGDRVVRLLAEETRNPALADVVEPGRRAHATWCERVFAAALGGLAGSERARRLAQLVAVTDVYTWKLLRRDRGLSRRQTELALIELLEPLTAR